MWSLFKAIFYLVNAATHVIEIIRRVQVFDLASSDPSAVIPL